MTCTGEAIGIAPQHSFLNAWEHNERNHEDHSCDSKLQLNVIDDDFGDLMMSDEVEDDASLGLTEHDGFAMIEPDPPSTPPPEDECGQEHEITLVREVTPDPRKGVVKMDVEDIRLPDLEELRGHYKTSCSKLASSIWQAEMTRRWHAQQVHLAGSFRTPQNVNGRAVLFLTGSRATLTDELEISRRKMWELIHLPENMEM